MKKTRLLLAAVMVPIFLYAATALAAEPEKAAAPKPRPEPKYVSMKFQQLGGGETTLKSFLKKDRTLLVFFQSACITCKSELLNLKEIFNGNVPKADLVGVGVDVRPETLDKFIAELGFPKVVLRDPQFTLGPKLKVTYTPAVVILDKEGHLVEVIGGYSDDTMDKIKAAIK